LIFVCPICKNELVENKKYYSCSGGHIFDKSKYGYVNLLMSQSSYHKRHGDDKMMALSRRNFLNKGFYDILLQNIISLLKEQLPPYPVILDAGCGECFYTEKISKAFSPCETYGIDLSKDALIIGNKRSRALNLCVSSTSKMPVKDESCDAVLSIFAPFCASEIQRVLKKDGVFLKVIPLQDHLWELKEAIYDKPYKNTVPDDKIENFRVVKTQDTHDTIFLDNNEDIENLFKMTPYYYKTSVKDQEKISKLCALETKISFRAILYKQY
jgi:23S rRNA (guanine745-N1)-methyltransferase